jgi:hypothetical protein
VLALARVPPQLRVLPGGTELWRIYFRAGGHPSYWDSFRTFGPLETARFDHHEPPPRRQARAILYAATAGPICVAEVFQSKRVINRLRNAPHLAAFKLTRPVRLLDLCGLWPTLAGASQAINSGPRSRARGWSRAIYGAYPDLDGLWYRSSMHGGDPAIALYERGRDALPSSPTYHAALADPGLTPVLFRVAQRIGYRLL